MTFFASFFAIAYIVPSVVRRRSQVDNLARTLVIGQRLIIPDGLGKSIPPAELAANRANVQIVGWAYNFGSRSVMCKSAVNAPADLAGKRIRTLPNKIITECLRLMGAAATPMAFGEIYTALQAGVLDGLEHDPPTIAASKFYETAKFYSLTQHNFSALGVFCSGLTPNSPARNGPGLVGVPVQLGGL